LSQFGPIFAFGADPSGKLEICIGWKNRARTPGNYSEHKPGQNSVQLNTDGGLSVLKLNTRRAKMDIGVIIGVATIAVVSITSHEAAHGFVANYFGDSTAREQGRLTLNPIPHIDPVFTLLLPALLIVSGSGFIFGGAKPVPVNVSRLGHPRRDWALVGAAGPLMNILIATGLTALLFAAIHLDLADIDSGATEALSIGIFLNALLAVFNLIPIPPLDGSRVVQYFLSGETLTLYRRLEQFGLIIILALVLLVPQVWMMLSGAIFGVVELITSVFGIWDFVEPWLRRLVSA